MSILFLPKNLQKKGFNRFKKAHKPKRVAINFVGLRLNHVYLHIYRYGGGIRTPSPKITSACCGITQQIRETSVFHRVVVKRRTHGVRIVYIIVIVVRPRRVEIV